jgi:hypothetical protein
MINRRNRSQQEHAFGAALLDALAKAESSTANWLRQFSV